jgi:hypothetical protein
MIHARGNTGFRGIISRKFREGHSLWLEDNDRALARRVAITYRSIPACQRSSPICPTGT